MFLYIFSHMRETRNLNVNDAKTMMIATLRWRDEFKLDEAMKETYPDMFNGFGHLYGRDKQRRPIMYRSPSFPVTCSQT